jgi:asparagine synthase (glutamine-hydrolysing)
MPVGQWFCGPLRTLLGDLLSTSRLAQAGLWNARHVRELLEAHWARRANHGQALWAIFVFEMWREQALRREPVGEVAACP